jgi:glycosyl transferase family 87
LNERSRGLALRGVVAMMTLLATAKLGDEMARLVWRSGATAAIDLKWRHAEVQGWFNGVPVYRTMLAPTYPPASYALLWPFLGWMSWEAARWFWAATTVVALAALAWLIVRETGATGAWQRALAVLLLLAMNETGVVVGNGQLTFHVLAPLVTGLLLIHRGSGTWAEDLTASVCVTFAMLKLTLAAPFLWVVVFAPSAAATHRMWPRRLRPALLIAVGYLALTVFAASFQDAGLLTQLREWIGVTRRVSDRVGDYADVSAWLTSAGLDRLTSVVSLLTFFALGVWGYRHRRVDLWVQLGVIAIVARFWAYHRQYDDVIVVLALVALFRIATGVVGRVGAAVPAAEAAREPQVRAAATALIVTCMLFMLLPARLGWAPPPGRQIFDVSHTASWLGMLVFLGWWARVSNDNLEAVRSAPTR